MYHEVLIPIDGSPGAESTIARTFDLARMFDAIVHVLYDIDIGLKPHELDSGERDVL